METVKTQIIFIGNCQIYSLCVFFTELLDNSKYDIKWVLFSPQVMHYFVGDWTRKKPDRKVDKCQMLTDGNLTLENLKIKPDDIIVYQHICELTSQNFNSSKIAKIECRKLSVSSIHYDKNDMSYLNTMKEKETANNTDIRASKYFDELNTNDFMISTWHPKTHLFKLLIIEIAEKLNLSELYDIKKQLEDVKYSVDSYTEL